MFGQARGQVSGDHGSPGVSWAGWPSWSPQEGTGRLGPLHSTHTQGHSGAGSLVQGPCATWEACHSEALTTRGGARYSDPNRQECSGKWGRGPKKGICCFTLKPSHSWVSWPCWVPLRSELLGVFLGRGCPQPLQGCAGPSGQRKSILGSPSS